MATTQALWKHKKKQISALVGHRYLPSFHHSKWTSTFTFLSLANSTRYQLLNNTNARNFKYQLLNNASARNFNSTSHGDAINFEQPGRVNELFDLLGFMDSAAYASILQSCANPKALPEVKLVHAHIVQTGFKPQTSLETGLLVAYVKCKSLVEAQHVLDEMPNRNVVSWTALISAYAKHGHGEEALTLFSQMLQSGLQPDEFTLASILPTCANLGVMQHSKEIHEHIIRSGIQTDTFVSNALVNMYVKFGSMDNAWKVFDRMIERDLVSWNVMIAGYVQNGDFDQALKLFKQILLAGVKPNNSIFTSVLPACTGLADPKEGKKVHECLIKSGCESDVFVGSALVDMYAKCGSLEDARKVFDSMPERNGISWTTMMLGYAQNGDVDETLEHFEKMPQQDVVSWSAMIALCAQNGCFDKALKLFLQMKQTGVMPNSVTFSSVLPACTNLAALQQGKEVHADIIRSGFQSDFFVESALVDMYAKSGCIEDARKVFDKIPKHNVVSWNAMVTGYAHNRLVNEALKLFQEMPERNVISWNAMILGYSLDGQVDEAFRIFQEMPEQDAVSWNVMIEGYVENGNVDKALQLFSKMPEKSVVSWTATIATCARNGYFHEALKLFQKMQLTGIRPNTVTFASVLPACANLAALRHGKEVHEDVIRSGIQSNVFVGSALIDMYAKCGRIEDAHRVFDKMPKKYTISWNAMITAYAIHGRGKEALKLFEQMQHSGTMPDRVSFLGILSACNHAGLVDYGWWYFDCMIQHYHIIPSVKHYGCMVDLLGRAGCLDEAQEFINRMPIKPDAAVWGSLIGACRIQNNIELGESVAEYLIELDPKNPAYYVLLSNIFAAAGKWEKKEQVRKMMKDRNIKMAPAFSWIEVSNNIHSFLVGDRSHPQMKEIYAKLERLSGQMKDKGYIPDTSCVLHDIEEEQKQQALVSHTEKLAIAFGLINTSPGTSIQIFKNLRVCNDCHSAIKFISMIDAREITVRDVNSFHHFKVGQCSCGDYW